MSISLARVQLFLLQLIVVLFFCQVWWEVSGFTARTEDLLTILAWGLALLTTLVQLRLRYRQAAPVLPMIAWMTTIGVGAVVAYLQPLPTDIKKDSIVNAARLVLGLSTFFLLLNHPADPRVKLRAVLQSVIGFSFVTTAVCLLQIAYWERWLNLPLPQLLTTIKEGADDEQGREIFGLFLGNTGTHIWAGMMAVQALAALSLSYVARTLILRYFMFGYFLLISLIIVRTSVRNSILGLAIAAFVLILLRALSRGILIGRAVKLMLIFCAAVALLVGLFQFAPDSYFIERIRRALPQVENGTIVIHRGSNIYGRIEYAMVALELFAERPAFGQGFFAYATLARQQTNLPIVHAHNSYVQTLAELGLVGFLALSWLFWSLGRKIWQIYWASGADPLMQAGASWLFSIAIFTVFTALFSNPFWEPQQMGILATLSGIMLHWYRVAIPARRATSQAIPARQTVAVFSPSASGADQ